MFDTGKDVSYYYEKWPVLVLMVWPSETDVITQAIITLDGSVLWRMSDSGWSVVLFLSSLLVEWGARAGLSEIQLDYFLQWGRRALAFCVGFQSTWVPDLLFLASSKWGVLCWLSPPGLVLSFPRFLWQHITHTNRTGWTIQVALLGVVCGHLFLPF